MSDENSLYDSLKLVEKMQCELDVYHYNLNTIQLNLTCDTFQSAVLTKQDHHFFEETLSFFSFLHKNHPEILKEWKATRKKD